MPCHTRYERAALLLCLALACAACGEDAAWPPVEELARPSVTANKLTAADGAVNDFFGWSLSVSD